MSRQAISVHTRELAPKTDSCDRFDPGACSLISNQFDMREQNSGVKVLLRNIFFSLEIIGADEGALLRERVAGACCGSKLPRVYLLLVVWKPNRKLQGYLVCGFQVCLRVLNFTIDLSESEECLFVFRSSFLSFVRSFIHRFVQLFLRSFVSISSFIRSIIRAFDSHVKASVYPKRPSFVGAALRLDVSRKPQ